MANIWWYNDGTQPDAHWDTPDNWWTDSGHSTPAGAIPVDGDSVFLLGSNTPDLTPSVVVTLAVFDSSGMATGTVLSSPTTANITIASSGSLVLGVAGDTTSNHGWAGATVDASATAVFQGGAGSAISSTFLTAAFSDSAGNAATLTVSGSCTFGGASYNGTGGSVYGNPVFSGTATTQSGSFIFGNPTFTGSSAAQAGSTINGNPIFGSSSVASGAINGDPTFATPARTVGCSVSGNSTFSGSIGLSVDGTFNGAIIFPGGSGNLLVGSGMTGGMQRA